MIDLWRYLERGIIPAGAVLKKRLDAKPLIVGRRIEQLIQETEGLGWNAPTSPRRFQGGPGAEPIMMYPAPLMPK